jgi:hypothetical protein
VDWLRQQLPQHCELAVGVGCDRHLAGAAQVLVLATGPARAGQVIPWTAAPARAPAAISVAALREVV